MKHLKIILLLIVVALIMGGVFAYLYFSKPQNQMTNVQSNSNDQNPNIETDNWKTFTNDNCGGYRLQYPNNWFVDDINKSNVYITPDLQYARAGEAMQIINDTVTERSIQQIAKAKYGKEGVDFTQEPMKIGGVEALKIKTIDITF